MAFPPAQAHATMLRMAGFAGPVLRPLGEDMDSPVRARARWLGLVGPVLLLLAWQLASAQVAAAIGGPLDSSVYIACGYGSTTPNPPANCPTLDQAWASVLSQDAASAAPATLVLLPGDYCSLNVRDDNNSPAGTIDRQITIVGAGTKPADVTFVWNGTDCAGSPGAAISFSHSFIEPLTLRNVSVDGSDGGPTTGISVTALSSPELTFRDVLVQNEPTGLNVLSDNMQVTNSSFVNNQIGAIMSGEWSVDGSTFAGNTNTGLSMSNYDGHLANDTIAHNGIGVAAPGSGNTVQVVNTIVGDNTNNDCSPTNDWESASFNATNLLAAGCLTQNSQTDGDIALTDSIGSLDTGDGITPYIPSPDQAIGAATPSLCGGVVGTDQLEETEEGGSACDIGSIDSENTGSTPTVGAQPGAIDAGHVPAGQTASEAMTWTNIGAGLLQVTSVDAIGDGLSVQSDGCTYQVLVPHQECFVTVGASPASSGDELTGTLKFVSNAIEGGISVTATGVAALAAPPDMPSVTVSRRAADLTWQPSPSENFTQNDFGLFYVMKESVDGGSSFGFAGEVDDADTGQITHLTPGTAYEFEVCTEDEYTEGKTDAADAPCSAPTAAVTPYDQSSLTHPPSTTIKDGGSVKLSTTLSDGTSHSAVANATVTLLARPASGSTFHSAGTAKTDSTGTASLTLAPTKNTQYEWTYSAAGAHASATSAMWTVTVKQTVAAALAHASIHHGKAGEVYGTIAPSASGLVVSLQYEHHGTWVTLTTAKTKRQTLPDHKKTVGYALKHTFASKGTFHLRVTRAATSTNAAGTSKSLTLTVT
jgi:hypothetical protein